MGGKEFESSAKPRALRLAFWPQMKNFRKVQKCRICSSHKLSKFLDLGSMPIPNGFLDKNSLKMLENQYELACLFCQQCGLVQLTTVINPNTMFKNYVYIPSGAKVMMNNFSHLAYETHQKLKLDGSKLVIDLGSNDGSLLTFYKSIGSRVLGIDPAENLAKVAQMKGIPTEVGLFDSKLAKKITKKFGKAVLITATNVIAHIDNLHEVWKGVSELLVDKGLFVTEFPYLLDLISKNQFDTIYHEHLSYFSLKPWQYLADLYGYQIVEAQRRLIHGGSIRLTHQKKKTRKTITDKNVSYLIGLEEDAGLYNLETFEQFTKRIYNLKKELKKTLKELKKQKKKIVGYGAAAKGNVLTNFFDIGKDILDYIVDSTPYKQGLYTPGKHIAVYSEEKLLKDMPDYALILAWNFADEIIAKQRQYRQKGGKFIIPVPEVKII